MIVPAYIPAHFTDALSSPLQLLAETRVPAWGPCPTMPPMWVQAEGWDGDGWAKLGQHGAEGLTQGCGLQPHQLSC